MPADSNEKPFKIAISDEQLSLLGKKLALHVLPDELEGAGHKYGASLTDVRRLVSRWQNGFDWRKEEARINEELPQFTRDIDVEGHGTLNIHYVHQKSEVDSAIPMLFVHGWPGSFIEVRKILPLLLNPGPDQPAFHVVALSLPGYGFSQGPKRQGFKSAQYAEVGNKLMLALGYEEYVTQGGDWGSIVSALFPRSVPKIKFNLIAPGYARDGKHVWQQAPDGVAHEHASYNTTNANLKALARRAIRPTGRPWPVVFHSIKCLSSPAIGLLTWIYEKIVVWTDNYPWDDDEVLTWISIYLFSRAGPAAPSFMYYEIIQAGEITTPFNWTTEAPVKLGVSTFPKEIIYASPSSIKEYRGLVFQADHDKGGHFAAYEVPELLVQDLRIMFGKAGPAYGVVPKKSGYST